MVCNVLGLQAAARCESFSTGNQTAGSFPLAWGGPFLLVEECVEVAEAEPIVATGSALRLHALITDPAPHRRNGDPEMIACWIDGDPWLGNVCEPLLDE